MSDVGHHRVNREAKPTLRGWTAQVIVDSGRTHFWRWPRVQAWKWCIRVGWRWTAIALSVGSQTDLLRQIDQERKAATR